MFTTLSPADAVRVYHGAAVDPVTGAVEGGEQVERRLAQLVADLRAQVADLKASRAALQDAVVVVLAAIDDSGREPAVHHQIMNQHRAEWPTLWRAIRRVRTVVKHAGRR